jgi:hypothetical protein
MPLLSIPDDRAGSLSDTPSCVLQFCDLSLVDLRPFIPRLSTTDLRMLCILSGGRCMVSVLYHGSSLSMPLDIFSTYGRNAVLMGFCLLFAFTSLLWA